MLLLTDRFENTKTVSRREGGAEKEIWTQKQSETRGKHVKRNDVSQGRRVDGCFAETEETVMERRESKMNDERERERKSPVVVSNAGLGDAAASLSLSLLQLRMNFLLIR